jgi:hypothetical protein
MLRRTLLLLGLSLCCLVPCRLLAQESPDRSLEREPTGVPEAVDEASAASPENTAGPRLDPVAELAPQAPLREPGTWSDIHGWRSFGWWAAGAATGFFAHEAGHVFANLVQGNVPKFQPIWGLGFVPFFAIEPRIYCHKGHCEKHDGSAFHGGVAGSATITTAGFDVQHITDEILLTRRPNLRTRQVAPYRKGLLAFNVLLSVGYAITSSTHIENPQGDVSSTTRVLGYPRAVLAAELMVVAGLDTYRYFWPESRWAPWVSRASKVAFFGANFLF